jgi:hypothetical protein
VFASFDRLIGARTFAQSTKGAGVLRAGSLAVAGARVDDRFSGLGPYVWAGVVVPGFDPTADVGVERAGVSVRGPLDFLVGEFREPPLDEVQSQLDVGVECDTKRRCAATHRWICAVLCVELLSTTMCTVRCGGTAWSIV